MTVRIIKKGRLPADRVYLFACTRCGCEWTATVDECLDRMEGTYRGGPWYNMKCPTCKVFTSSDTEVTDG